MLNRIAAIFLLVALMSSYFSRYTTYAAFEINQSYISKTLCVNKSRPEMHCNGRCYLMRKMKAAEQKEQKQARESQRQQLQEVMPKQLSLVPAFAQTVFCIKYPQRSVAGTVSRSSAIFQPPRLS